MGKKCAPRNLFPLLAVRIVNRTRRLQGSRVFFVSVMKPVCPTRVTLPRFFGRSIEETLLRGTLEIRLLMRTLRRRSAVSAIRTSLLNESMAYQLVWPD